MGNFEGKRVFIEKMGGLEFLAGCLNDEKDKKILRKILFLMHDLVINDDSIFTQDPTLCRLSFSHCVDRLLTILNEDAEVLDSDGNMLWDNREYNLRILFKVFQVAPQVYKKNACKIK